MNTEDTEVARRGTEKGKRLNTGVLRFAQDDEFCAGWEGERRTVWGEKFEW
jgi:hypothetical protein